MIKYNLICKCNCTFDSWFASSEEFGRLMKKKLITCIECNSNTVHKSIMAPNVSNSKKIDNINYKLQKNIRKKIVNMLVITLLRKLGAFIIIIKKKQKVFMVE